MLLALDVGYADDHSALAGGVLMVDHRDAVPARTLTKKIARVSDYVPGSFYLRELPCLLAVLEEITEPVSSLIIDGYVDLDGRPGLGRRLYDHLSGKMAVIGVAKTRYAGATAQQVFRGDSHKPLLVSAAGMDAAIAADMIREMHGAHRIPTLLTVVDHLSRGWVKPQPK